MASWVSRPWLVAMLALSACAYVTEDEFMAQYDADGDGWPGEAGEDCADDPTDPTAAQIYPFAPDWRGDGCDADCGRTPDADGDDWPDDNDCAPSDPDVYPCKGTDAPGGVDEDCDGDVDAPRSTACPVPLKADPNYDPLDSDVDAGGLFPSDSCAFPSVPHVPAG